MEANFILKASDLTADFAEGIRKVFSANATLHIRVELGSNSGSSATAYTGKKRGRKPGLKQAATAGNEAPKKRGRKPGFKLNKTAASSNDAPKKRGRPKATTA